ncbi:TaqI-like C-terminal specificity domain-containing protein [Thermodesulfovibrio hydrogeniphilus]
MKEQIKELPQKIGAVSTPPWLVEFMVELANPNKSHCRILEPACGDCPFLIKFAERYGYYHEFVGIDIDPEAINSAKKRTSFATLIESDFLLWDSNERFDIIIGNPPYGIIGDASHYPIYALKERKTLYRKKFLSWQGKFNIYGAFIEHAVRLLTPSGKLVFVVPASWLVLDEFAKLRTFLAYMGKLIIYYLGKVFKGRNVSCVVMVLEKGGQGLELYDKKNLLVRKIDYKGEIIRFETKETIEWESSGIPLGLIFDIYFAARSPEFRRHPSVITRPKEGLVPVLTGRNLKAGYIDYDTCFSGLWMPKEEAVDLRFFYSFPHIVVGHTKGCRVVAALDERCYPWREEIHLVPKYEGINEVELVKYLNSEHVQNNLRTLYRDFIPQLTISQLKIIPVPSGLVSVSKGKILTLWEVEA